MTKIHDIRHIVDLIYMHMFKFIQRSSQDIVNDDIFRHRKNETNKQNRSTEGCSKLKRSVDMTSPGKNGFNIGTNASPQCDRTRCPEE